MSNITEGMAPIYRERVEKIEKEILAITNNADGYFSPIIQPPNRTAGVLQRLNRPCAERLSGFANVEFYDIVGQV